MRRLVPVLAVSACWHGAPPPPALVPAATAPSGCVAAFESGAPARCRTGERIDIRFPRPVFSEPTDRAWITIAPAGAPPETYREWKYLPHRARAAALTAPDDAGTFEVRLHTHYPEEAFHVSQVVRVEVASRDAAPVPAATPTADQRFSLAASSVAPGAPLDLRFAAPLRAAPDERFWITVVPDVLPDSQWGAWTYITDGAATATLAAPLQPGRYEVRLHANYPAQATNVVHREPVVVQ